MKKEEYQKKINKLYEEKSENNFKIKQLESKELCLSKTDYNVGNLMGDIKKYWKDDPEFSKKMFSLEEEYKNANSKTKCKLVDERNNLSQRRKEILKKEDYYNTQYKKEKE